jgi:hypothetical protein
MNEKLLTIAAKSLMPCDTRPDFSIPHPLCVVITESGSKWLPLCNAVAPFYYLRGHVTRTAVNLAFKFKILKLPIMKSPYSQSPQASVADTAFFGVNINPVKYNPK